MATRGVVVREGITTGLIGAIVIAVWFAVLDAVRGEMFATPIGLGTALGTMFTGRYTPPGPAAAMTIYTMFHFAAFIIVGLIFAWVVNAAERAPSALIGFLGLFVAVEVGFIGFTQMLAIDADSRLPWLQVGLANVLAAAAMGYYMWRQHPGLAKRVDRVLAGAPE
jgi:hypothetical protein